MSGDGTILQSHPLVVPGATTTRGMQPVAAGLLSPRTEDLLQTLTERPSMRDNASAIADREALLDTFVAELTRAAYDVALRHRAAGTWLELELDLWRTLA